MFSKINLNSLILLFIFSFCTSVFAQSDFEGKVVMRISGEHPTNVDYFIKENNMRMEMKSEEGSVVIIYDQKNSKTYMIMPEQKMYMVLPGIDQIPQGDSKTDDYSPAIDKTGEFKDINGYKCEKWIIKDENSTVEAWMTDELGNFYMMNNPMKRSAKSKWEEELQGKFFPMKVDAVEDGEKTTSLEVISVDKMSLNSDLFVVPEGFQKFDMPNMDMYNKKN